MSGLRQDASFAARALRRRPIFAAITAVTIALGVGAATSIYSVVDGVVFRPLPFRDPARIIAIWQTFPAWRKNPVLATSWDHIGLSAPEYRDLRDNEHAFDDVAIWTTSRALLSTDNSLVELRALHVSSSMLRVLGVSPIKGRSFLPDEDTPAGPRVAMISFEMWQARYGGAQDIVGRVVQLDDAATQIVGVLPAGLTIGRTTAVETTDPMLLLPAFWVPVGHDATSYQDRGDRSYFAIGRLAPGITIDRAATEASRILHPTEQDAAERGVRLAEWQTDQTRETRAPLYVLLTAAMTLLLISCVNVATLLLGEATTREREMATRIAVGASRTRIARQLLTESLILSMIGSAAGALLSWWGTRAMVAIAPPRVPGLADVHMDARILAFCVLVAVTTGLLFGLAPALALSRTSPGAFFRAGGQSARGRIGLQRLFIGVQLALSVLLLVTAGLLARSVQRISSVDPGFRTEHLLIAEVSPPVSMRQDSIRTRQLEADLFARLAGLPGVEAVTAASAPPFGAARSSSGFQIESESDQPLAGGPGDASRRHAAQQRVTIPGYFATLGIPLLAGRDFTVADMRGAANVVIVSDALARRDFPNASPLGARVKFQSEWRTIVGVASDVHLSKLTSDLEATIYLPDAQRPGSSVLPAFIRTRGDPLTLAASVRALVAQLSPPETIVTVKSMDAMIAGSFSEERYRALLISLFGVFAVILAAVGTYGVTSRAVAQRTRELAIRSALGATQGSIMRNIVGATLVGAAAGAACGFVAAVGATRWLTPYLFGVTATDPLTYGAIFALLVMITFGATWAPTRRVMRLALTEILGAN